MAAPSTELQTLATSYNISYESEETYLGTQMWVWDDTSSNSDDVAEFFREAVENGYINNEQNGLAIPSDNPMSSDGKLRIPTS